MSNNQCVLPVRVLSAALSALVFVAAIGSAPQVQAQVNRELYFSNDCHYPLRLFVMHRHSDDQNYVHGWYDMRAKQSITKMAGSGGAPLVHIEGNPLYIYAEATGSVPVYWQGSQTATFNGVRYGTMATTLNVDSGRLYFNLGCEGY